MRLTLTIILLGLGALSGCRCSPENPSPVTMRIINSTRAPIFVDQTNGKLGLTVQREVGGQLYGFDDLACECRFCTNVCNTACTCPDAGVDQVLRIAAGATVERGWDGVVQTAGASTCSSDGCLTQVNAPLNEAFTLELCFSAQIPTGVIFNDAGVGAGRVPMVNTTCTTKTFAPQDGTVEIGPERGSTCTTTSECRGMNELCFDGACTAGCPANDIPQVGAEWILTVASPDNMGFFEQTARGAKGNQFEGTGTLTSALYQSSSLQLRFSRAGTVPGEMLTGGVQIKLPVGTGAALITGTQVKATVIDDGEEARTRAFIMRDAVTNEVLFAADTAQNGELLTPADLVPFAVSTGPAPIGCTQDSCGRLLYTTRRFSNGNTFIDVDPGKQGTLALTPSAFNFLNVTSGAYQSTSCDTTTLRPYAFWKVTTP